MSYYTPNHAHSSNLSRYPSTRPRPYGYQQGPPTGADPQLWQWFCAVDTDRSGALSVTELQDALVNEFDLDTVKMLMNIFDTDRSGTIGFNEFAGLWKYIAEWQRVFKHFDRDHSGSIEGRELAEALRSFGYNLSPVLLQALEIRYASGAPSAYGPPPGITFDRFVRACVTVKTLTETFQRADHDNDGWIQLNHEEFLKIALNAP
ncbi:EF-hand [Suillus paluster]|uniref:EF-hand n=1 Tax=Suillus paluster TaxID=48578 RepID=UPI001B8817ED|nr:EF-hand [Suillus paluster]KAG1749015.1 EF-hand [Suillus paluster]